MVTTYISDFCYVLEAVNIYVLSFGNLSGFKYFGGGEKGESPNFRAPNVFGTLLQWGVKITFPGAYGIM